VINSMLSEEAVLAFEYGYTLAEPNALTMWEAQFGDFANGAQVVFDQFISSGERKWLRMSGLVCLLPHGYEGQGPEHSSARLERFLQLCAEDNWQVANCSTPANYFHILRRQLHRKFRKPLVLMTPEVAAAPQARGVGPGRDGPRHDLPSALLWDDAQSRSGEKIKLKTTTRSAASCCAPGKVYYDLYEAREAAGIDDVYLMRVEQLLSRSRPRALITELSRFPQADVVWAQEEPKNMGAWSFIEPNIEWVLQHTKASSTRPRYVGRPATAARRRASPASTIRSRRRWSRRRSPDREGGKDGD
jgi:2-oxoglutarate dehydrogenase E1 component